MNADAYFDFRTISSADPVRVGDRYYLFYEGVRGPGPGDPGRYPIPTGIWRVQRPKPLTVRGNFTPPIQFCSTFQATLE